MLLFSQCAAAVGLGDIEVRSALGQVLDARIPLALEPGKAVDASCFSLMRGARDEAVPTLVRGAITLERTAGATALRIRSPVTISEPALALRVRAACPGRPDQDERQYTVLLDPQPGSEGVRSVPVIGASLAARAGDTLPSIAAQVFPKNPTARTQYLAALREANPHLAARGDGPLPEGAAISLPDLRTYARGRAPTGPPVTVAKAEPPPRVALPTPKAAEPIPKAAAPTPRVAAPPPPTLVAKATPPPAAAPAAPAAPPPAKPVAVVPPPPEPKGVAANAFTLKLSTADVDLARTQGMDDRKRAQLRERLALLDEDDHVAALLSLRNNVRQLESRVAELQLKLASMPPALAAAPPASRAPAPPATLDAPKMVEPTKVEPAKVEPTKVEPTKKVEPLKVEPTKKVEPARMEPTKKAEPAKQVAEPVAPRPVPDGAPWWKEYLTTPWAWGLLVMALLAALLMRRPPRRVAGDGDSTPSALLPSPPSAKAPPSGKEDASLARPPAAADAALATRLPENARELRRRYIEERFPEVGNRTLALEDPSSVVKAARLFYEDGAIPRAVELLRFSIEDNPAEVRPWLALFEIFRLERRADEYSALAARFHDHHGSSEYWRKVQHFGREIDPTNPLYREDSPEGLEASAPKQARPAAAATSFDAAAENWLEAPMDFENEILANELRQALMARGALDERDLEPNPMPALRNIEIFRVA